VVAGHYHPAASPRSRPIWLAIFVAFGGSHQSGSGEGHLRIRPDRLRSSCPVSPSLAGGEQSFTAPLPQPDVSRSSVSQCQNDLPGPEEDGCLICGARNAFRAEWCGCRWSRAVCVWGWWVVVLGVESGPPVSLPDHLPSWLRSARCQQLAGLIRCPIGSGHHAQCPQPVL